MEVIYALKRPTINEFASFIRISQPNAAYKVNNLIKKGYLNKVQSETDRREYYLEVTDKYLAYYNVGSFYMYETLARTRKRLTKEQLETAVEVLHIILDEMRSDMPEFKSI
jgi:DNA-binding MarR family transcriptional regulator